MNGLADLNLDVQPEKLIKQSKPYDFNVAYWFLKKSKIAMRKWRGFLSLAEIDSIKIILRKVPSVNFFKLF